MIQIITTIFLLPIIFFNSLYSLTQPPIVKKPQQINVKGIYITAYTVSYPTRYDKLVKLVEDTELNAIVIDLKDYTGHVLYDSKIPLVNQLGTEDIVIADVKALVDKLKEKGIYTIARIAVFQDPKLAETKPEWALKNKKTGKLWRDYKGLAWVDTSNKKVWNYNLAIAKEAVDFGFDEINLDYIRFPSDGDILDIDYAYTENTKKVEVMKEFFRYFGTSMAAEPVYTSVDLFGMTLTMDDGLNIGQRIEDAAPYFDYICPMVYPSHYPRTFRGYNNPADYPYEIINLSLEEGKDKLKNTKAKYRPWLQDFDLGAIYDASMIRKQIQAVYDNDGAGWMLWNASNNYTSSALKRE
ncbi:putative glycoside hydrolase [Patescibacteria group bacterium]|nr:putative glycoside hydrolase [Patescibacteria group bacterium]